MSTHKKFLMQIFSLWTLRRRCCKTRRLTRVTTLPKFCRKLWAKLTILLQTRCRECSWHSNKRQKSIAKLTTKVKPLVWKFNGDFSTTKLRPGLPTFSYVRLFLRLPWECFSNQTFANWDPNNSRRWKFTFRFQKTWPRRVLLCFLSWKRQARSFSGQTCWCLWT